MWPMEDTLRPVNDATEGSTQEATNVCYFLKKLPFLCEFPILPKTGWWVLPACFLRASCMLPACFLHASCVLPSVLLLHVTVYQNHYFKAKLDENSHYFANFFRKHAGSTHVQCIFVSPFTHFQLDLLIIKDWNSEFTCKLYNYRVYHNEMDETKWLWRVEESIILLNSGAYTVVFL